MNRAIGDRVLAPWEPLWSYPGTVIGFEGDKALILFDDGDRANVSLDQLRPIALSVGDCIQARKDRRFKQYLPAEIIAINGDNLQIRYMDSSRDSLTVGYVRVPLRIAIEAAPRPLPS